MGRKVTMLAHLKVHGFAIIEELEIEFGEGLNVISGETGSGKSIIMNALSTFLDSKVSSDMVRTGADHAEVTGQFFAGDVECLLKRVITPAGRSRAFLDGEPVVFARLEDSGNALLSVYGQNESRHLLDMGSYVVIIDNLLGLGPERELLAQKVEGFRKVTADLRVKNNEAAGRLKETSFLEYQIDEIEKAGLKDEEEEALRERLKILRDAGRIQGGLEQIIEEFYEGEKPVHNILTGSSGTLKPFGHIETIEGIRRKIDSMALDIEDVVMEIRGLIKGLSFDADEMSKTEERLGTIYDLKSKYGNTVKDIHHWLGEARARLAYLKGLSGAIGELEQQKATLETEVNEKADILSRKRKKGVKAIESALVEELSLLALKGAVFSIAISEKGTIDEEGKDAMDLLLSTNPGEPLKPLRRIVSGGELSRIMLAIKKVMGGDERKTLIFDEVDAGIGGKVADVVGRRLKELSRNHQIVCITHLPQIAVYGDHHFLVEKRFVDGGTKTVIKKLSPDERVREVARMLGGASVTEKTLERAEEMLSHG